MKLTPSFNDRHRAILRIALPAIVTNITTPILGLVDLAIAGHLGSAAFIGAIAVGSSLFNMIYWLLNFLRAGTSGLTAQAVGAGHSIQRDEIFFRGLFIGAFLGLLTLLLSPLLAAVFLPFMESDAPTTALAKRYFLTVIWGAPAYLATYAITGWLLGNQNSVATLRIAILTNVVNILLSILFVFILKMKIEGVALGTALSQWIGCLYGLWLIRRRYAPRLATFKGLFQGEKIKRFFSINFDIFLRTACLVAVTLWFTRTGAKMGTDILAANALLMQLFLLFSFFMDGFAYAGEAIAGKELGAGHQEKIRALEKDLLKWGLSLALLGCIIYFFAGELILGLLTKEEGVKAVAADYLAWAITIPLFGFMAFIYDGIFIGMTLTRKMLISMACAMAIFFLTYFLLRQAWGNHALWLAFSLYLLTRGLAQTLLLQYSRIRRLHL